MTDYENLLSKIASAMQPNPIRRLTALLARGNVISLAAGAPSAETFPQEELAQIAARVIRDSGPLALQYGPTRGNRQLVEQVAEIMRARGVREASPSGIVMTTGSQQGLDLAARLLIDPGDVAIVELPGYIGGIIALHNAGAELIGARQDEDGIDVEDARSRIERLRAEGRRVKLIYTIPNFQNPSGVTLSAERRRELIALAEEHDLFIIEDDPYCELHFAGEAERPGPVVAIDRSRVIYLSSFSKVLAPGLRVAWLFAPDPMAAKIELMKEGADLSSSVLDQAIVAEAVREGLIERRLPEIRRFYEARCRAALDALEEHAPRGSKWTRPSGGFFILLEVAEGIDATELLPRAIDEGVAFVPGQPFFVDGRGANTLRLAFSKETPEKIAEGIKRLCRLLS
jgi:2-aminoadipate transaminase